MPILSNLATKSKNFISKFPTPSALGQSLSKGFQAAGDAYFKAAEPVQGQPVKNFVKGMALTPRSETEEQTKLMSSDYKSLSPEDKAKLTDYYSQQSVFGLSEPGVRSVEDVATSPVEAFGIIGGLSLAGNEETNRDKLWHERLVVQ